MASYTVNYNDERFAEVEAQKQQALAKLNKTYDTMISQTDGYYQDQIDASKAWAETQKKNQQEQTDFAIEKIEQQKDQTKKDYTKEQSGAYVDWQKQSGDYGVNAEQMAAQGMENTGYAESSQVSMYNTYQNRVATAREAYTRAILNYDNAIKDAILQNNAALAEIAAKALEKQLEIALAGFQYKNTLVMAKTNAQLDVDNTYYGRYQDVLSQINTENSLAEQVRQYNANLAEEKRQYNESLALQREQFEYQKAQDAAAKISKSSGGSSGGGGSSSSKSSKSSSSSKSSGSSSVKKSSSSSSTKSGGRANVSVDMKSVLALGYGPISSSKLADLENKGLVTSYTSGNKIKFKHTPYAQTQAKLFR